MALMVDETLALMLQKQVAWKLITIRSGKVFDDVFCGLMVKGTTMTVVMAEKDLPVFRDFLGIGRKEDSAASKQGQQSAGFASRSNGGFVEDGEAETPVRASSGNSGRFETPPATGLMTPPFAVAFPSETGPGNDAVALCKCGEACRMSVTLVILVKAPESWVLFVLE
jgi:hypothetical protein